ncbi:MAG: Hpt domain-containing protein [Rhizobiales bacterium]|nr:Hpt domain-containing protein [Hyphomicrobiales bacterium]NRB13848.1 Hpt domain-containing protein [Hyphomicrobiales bacterium]
MFANQSSRDLEYNNKSVSPIDEYVNAHCEDAVDLEHLGRYTMGNFELEQEILQLFCDQCVDYVSSLKTSLEDPEGWKQATHALKGSARGVGAWRIAAETQVAELLMGDALYTDRVSAVHAIGFAVEEVAGFVKLKYA